MATSKKKARVIRKNVRLASGKKSKRSTRQSKKSRKLHLDLEFIAQTPFAELADSVLSEGPEKSKPVPPRMPEDVTVLIPAYNESENITRVCESLKEMQANVIIVDDGSTDRTGKIGKRFGFKVIRHNENKGKGAAIRAGLEAATTSKIVLMDGDSQHDVKDIPLLLQKLEKADLVVGNRFGKDLEMPFHRLAANALMRAVVSPKARVDDALCGFRAFRKNAVRISQDGFNSDLEMIFNAVEDRKRLAQVPVSVDYSIKKERCKTSGLLRGGREYARLFGHAISWRLK